MQGSTTRAFGCPQKYIQGPGELRSLPGYAAALGKKPLFVLDSGVYELFFPKIKAAFDAKEMPFEVWRYQGESCPENIEAGKDACQRLGCDLIVGFGGGKCIDTSKFISDDLDLPRIIMPTSASTDAPTAGLSVLYSKEGVHLKSVKLKRPSELVLIDSEIIAAAPARLFSAGIGDALATYFEALANDATQGKNFIGQGYVMCRAAMAIARECYEILMADGESALMAVKENVLTQAVENVIEANTLLSGLGFENSGCAGAHGIHSGFSEIESAHQYLHGEKVAFGLLCQLVLENAPKELIDRIVRFEMAVDLPVCLAQINIEPSEENLNIIADHVINHNVLINNEPHIVNEDVIKQCILAADRIGRSYLEGRGLLL